MLSGKLGDKAYEFAASMALAWIRPDALFAGVANRIIEGIRGADFKIVAALPTVLDRHGVRALWAYELKRATAERMMLLDGLVNLGAGLVILCQLKDRTNSAAEHLTSLKGSNDPTIREPGSLRELAESPNRLLTMLHTASDAADVVRELAIFATPDEFNRVLLQIACLDGVQQGIELSVLDTVEEIDHSNGICPWLVTGDRAANELMLREVLRNGTAKARWRAIEAFSERMPLLKAVPLGTGEC